MTTTADIQEYLDAEVPTTREVEYNIITMRDGKAWITGQSGHKTLALAQAARDKLNPKDGPYFIAKYVQVYHRPIVMEG